MPSGWQIIPARLSALGRQLTLLRAILAVLACAVVRRWWCGEAAEGPPAKLATGASRPPRGGSVPNGPGRPPRRGTGGPSRSNGGGGGGTRPSGHHRRIPEVAEAPREEAAGPLASASEVGAHWHFDGRRRWAWQHDGDRTNGFIEFGAAGKLWTNFRGLWSEGEWQLRHGDIMRATFGKCHHDLALVGEATPPAFVLHERQMKDGSRTRDRGPPRTRGYLLDTPCIEMPSSTCVGLGLEAWGLRPGGPGLGSKARAWGLGSGVWGPVPGARGPRLGPRARGAFWAGLLPF